MRHHPARPQILEGIASMSTCSNCGLTFVPQPPAWGDETCGECIADRIEYGLLGGLLFAERKPLRRATGESAEMPTYDEEVRRKA
jgi:hypothetical protein